MISAPWLGLVMGSMGSLQDSSRCYSILGCCGPVYKDSSGFFGILDSCALTDPGHGIHGIVTGFTNIEDQFKRIFQDFFSEASGFLDCGSVFQILNYWRIWWLPDFVIKPRSFRILSPSLRYPKILQDLCYHHALYHEFNKASGGSLRICQDSSRTGRLTESKVMKTPGTIWKVTNS